MEKISTNIMLILIVILAFVLRIWMIGAVPPSPDWDEASLGYNAYSILHTGKDEYGKMLPLILRSFDDYKPGLYTYFIIPLLPLFGLSLVSVRLPAVLFGVLAVIVTYYLVTELLSYKKEKSSNQAHVIGLASAFLLAISPWHIQFTRIAFESSVGVAFNIFSALAFIKGLRKPYYFVVCGILMALNLYIYQSEKVFTPLLLVALVAAFRKEIFAAPRKWIVMAIIVGTIVSLPMVSFTLTSKEGLARAKGVSVFSDQTTFLKDNAQKIIRDKKNNDTIGLILDNRRFAYIKAVISGYIAHFDLNWLFISSDLPRHHAPFMGLLYIWELPFVFIGMYYLLFGPFPGSAKLLIFLWFLFVPIPASITSGVPHSIRTLNYLPLYPIFTAIGLLVSFGYVKRWGRGVRLISIFLFSILMVFNFSYYMDQYFVQQNYYVSEDWQYGYKDAVSLVKNTETKYDKIIISNKPPLDQSYMFFLFYLQYPPDLYQKESQSSSGGFRENHSFGKYEFRSIEWTKEEKTDNILYIGRPEDFSGNARVLKTIYYLNKKPAIKIVQG